MTPAAAPRYDPREMEDRLMALIGQAIRNGEVCPTSEELAFRLDIGFSTVPTILRRLEARGLITRRIFQRTRQVTIVATGRSTAMPSNTSPHWRNRPKKERVPSPSIDAVRRRNPDIAARMMVAARREGKDLAAFLADMVWLGFRQYEAEEQA